MKKFLIVFLCALMLCAAFANAENMVVVNCKEWVSLREEPTTESNRITKIPLGSVVWDCVEAEEGWIRGTYCGMTGYVSADYLSESTSSDTLNFASDGVIVFGNYSYGENGESYEIDALSETGEALWQYSAKCSYSTELRTVDAFIAGTEDAPVVMAYSCEQGLTALDLYTGETIWTLSPEVISLGGGICHAVDADGTIYVGGFYGPDPIAISSNGEILWEANFNDAYYWLHKIEIEGENLLCYYDMSDKGDTPAQVSITKNGDFAGIEYEESA